MRSTKTLVVLALVTLAFALAAVFTRQQSTAIPQQGALLFPQLLARLNDTAEIVGTSHDATFTLARQDGAWVVKEKHGYRADADKVRRLLIGTAELRRIEPKTSNPALYAQIGLQDMSAKDAKSLQISLKNANGGVLADYILGHWQSAKGDPELHDYFVRLPGDPQTWLVEGKLPDDKTPFSWLDKTILRLGATRIHEVRVTHPGGQTVIVRRPDPGAEDYQLVDLPKGTQIESTYTVNSIGRAFTNLTLTDVKPASTVDLKRDKAGVRVALTTFDGLRVNMQTATDGDANLAELHAAFDAALVQDHAADTKKSAEPKAPEQKNGLKTPSEVKEEVEALNSRWKDWVYVIAPYQAESLAKKKSELIKVSGKHKAGSKGAR
jgi:hypothetical protein